jgi:hypothetical protein
MLLVQARQVKRFFQKEARNLIECTKQSKALPVNIYLDTLPGAPCAVRKYLPVSLATIQE